MLVAASEIKIAKMRKTERPPISGLCSTVTELLAVSVHQSRPLPFKLCLLKVVRKSVHQTRTGSAWRMQHAAMLLIKELCCAQKEMQLRELKPKEKPQPLRELKPKPKPPKQKKPKQKPPKDNDFWRCSLDSWHC